MIKHIVMWRLKNVADDINKQAAAQRMQSLLEGLQAQISQIKKIEVGINIAPGLDAADIVLYSEFETLADLNAYQQHPAHLEVAEFVKTVRIERRVVDYETH